MNLNRLSYSINYYILGTIVFLASIRSPNVEEFALDYFVPAPIKTLQNSSLPIIAVLMILGIFSHKFQKSNRTKIPIPLLCYFIFQIILVITGSTISQNWIEFISRFILTGLTFLYFQKNVSSMPFYARGKEKSILWSVFWGSFIFILANIFIYLASIGNVIWKGRMFGITAHPNFIGLCASISVCVSFGIFLASNSQKRNLYLVPLALAFWVCILSGSRTSTFSALLSIILLAVNSIKTLELKSIIVSLTILLIVFLSNTISIDALDYEGRGNTREETWTALFNQVSQLPIFGIGKTGATSNGYLFSIVASGLFGSLFLFVAVYGVIHFCLRGSSIQKDKSSINIYRSLTLIVVFASMFEGFLLDTAGMPVYVFWILLAKIK